VTGSLTEAELVERLAHVSHQTWMKQKKRKDNIVVDPCDPAPTEHDFERARDLVGELKNLGLWTPTT
jgi:hypothetical protein